MTIKLHIKNNHAGPDTFPSTPESEPVFTISMDKYRQAAELFPELAARLEVFVDWDTDHWIESMRDSEILLTWNLPTENLAAVAPKLNVGLGARGRDDYQQQGRARRQGG
jgi:hypothetical protein